MSIIKEIIIVKGNIPVSATDVVVNRKSVWSKPVEVDIPVEPPKPDPVPVEPPKPDPVPVEPPKPDPVPVDPPKNFRDEYIGDSNITWEQYKAWCERAEKGPFKKKNDYSKNSYNDWEKIIAEKNRYLANGVIKFDYKKENLNSDGSIKITSSIVTYENSLSHHGLMSAAQYALIKKESNLLKSCLNDVMECIKTSYSGSRRDRLPKSGNYHGDQNPLFELPIYASRYLRVYDICLAGEGLGILSITSAQKKAFEKYLFGWMDWFMWSCRTQMLNYFKNKTSSGVYEVDAYDDPAKWTLTNTVKSSQFPSYHGQTGSNLSFTMNRNNRTAAIAGAIGEFAPHLIGTEYDAQAKEGIKLFKKYVKSYIIYGILPNGLFPELYRSYAGNTHLALYYLSNALGCQILGMDAIARKTNDFELYNWSTRKNMNESKLLDIDKSWKWVCDNYMDFLDGTRNNVYNRDYLNVPVGDREKMKFDGYSETTKRRVVRGIYFVLANDFYGDPRWWKIMDCSHSKTQPQPGFEENYGGHPDTFTHGISGQQLIPLFSYFKIPPPLHFSLK